MENRVAPSCKHIKYSQKQTQSVTLERSVFEHRFKYLFQLTVATLHNVEYNRVQSDINKRNTHIRTHT